MPSTDIPIADTTEREFPQQEPIAIVGIGCRYSGDINNLEDFWKMLVEKRSTLSDVPGDRFSNTETLVDPERGVRKIVTRKGGWLQRLKGI
jgi:acyl transferase domain-containing protein